MALECAGDLSRSLFGRCKPSKKSFPRVFFEGFSRVFYGLPKVFRGFSRVFRGFFDGVSGVS